MLHILLLILKIIGITLLVILGVVFVILLIVLFAPIRYQIKAETSNGIKQLKIDGKANWIMHLISAKFTYNKVLHWQARIAWKQYPQKPDQCSTETCENAAQEDKNTKKADTQESKTEETGTQENDNNVHKTKQTPFGKLKCTIANVCDKIKQAWSVKEQILDFLMDESHISAFQSLKQEIVKLAKRIRPRKINGFVRFGLEDPYRTGQVLAVLSVLYPFYGENIQIFPEFEYSILEGDLFIKGYIRFIHILIPLCKLYFDEHVRKTYYDYKKEKTR